MHSKWRHRAGEGEEGETMGSDRTDTKDAGTDIKRSNRIISSAKKKARGKTTSLI